MSASGIDNEKVRQVALFREVRVDACLTPDYACTIADCSDHDVRLGQLLFLAIGLTVVVAGRLVFLAGAIFLN